MVTSTLVICQNPKVRQAKSK